MKTSSHGDAGKFHWRFAHSVSWGLSLFGMLLFAGCDVMVEDDDDSDIIVPDVDEPDTDVHIDDDEPDIINPPDVDINEGPDIDINEAPDVDIDTPDVDVNETDPDGGDDNAAN